MTGIGQLALIVAAFSRVIDPGPPAFDAMGVVAGIGMAIVALIVVGIGVPARTVWLRPVSLVALFAGGG